MKYQIILFTSIILGLSGCHQSAATTDTPTPPIQAASLPAEPVSQRNLLEDREALALAKSRLQALPSFAEKPVQVFGNVDFFDGIQPRIELSVQNPNQPNEIWFMRYQHGKWSEPIVEDVSDDTPISQISRHLTPLSEIHFVDVPVIAQHWRQKAKEVNAVWQEPYYVSFIWLPKLKKRFWHSAQIEAVGAQYYLSVNLDGNIWEWKKL